MSGNGKVPRLLLNEVGTLQHRVLELESELEEVQKAEVKSRIAAESLPTAMVMVNEQGKIVLVNAQTEKLFGYSREELLDQHVEMLVPHRFREKHPDHRRDFFTHPVARAMGVGRDLFGQRKDGSEFPVEIGLNPIETVDGRFVLSAIVDITERKSAERRFRQAVESAPNAMVMVNEQGKIVLSNAQTERLFGYTREELLDQPVEMLVPGRFREKHPAYRARFFARPEVRAMGTGRDLFGQRKDGSEFPVEIGLNPIETEEGTFVLSAIVDITERKQAEESIRRSESRKAAILESSLDAIVTMDEEGTVVEFNPAAEKTFGYIRSDVIGKSMAELIVPPSYRAKHTQGLATFRHTGAGPVLGKRLELTAMRSDGSEFPCELAVTRIASSTPAMFTGYIRDITDRRLAEERFRQAVESAPSAMVMVDQQGRIVLVNQQTEMLFGYARHELLGQSVELIVPERFRDKHPAYRDGFFAKPEVRAMGAGRDLYGQRKDGSEFPVEIGLNPIQTEEGCFVLSAIVDITDRRRNEEKVHRFNEELERRVAERTEQLEVANKELEAFSYSVSHDLRAPLRAIDGFSHILLKQYADSLPDEAREYLHDVRMNTQQMGHLIDDLLAFSRLSRQPVNKQRFDPTKVARQCFDDLLTQQSSRRVEFQLGRLAVCSADVTLMRQVWTNLISNALKYSASRQPAVIEIGDGPGGSASERMYFIKDNGVGFDARYAHKLFGVFQRLHRSDEYEGTGVGLAIVQRIIQRHGGRVWAEAELDKGATFYFTLPTEELTNA